MKNIVTFSNVNFSYRSGQVLENVSFSIEEGDFVSIIGPNGGGKTTMAKLTLGLLQPDTGTITVLDKKPVSARSKIGYVPQYSLFDPQFPISVKEVVLMGKMGSKKFFFSKQDHENAAGAIEKAGLSPVLNHSFSELSGGQRQRVLIARALISKPRILLMDEPTASVDSTVEKKMSTLLEQLKTTLTVILITHDMGFVSNLVTKVICVNREVNIHPTTSITTEYLEHLYQKSMKAVRHDIKEVH